MEVWDFFLNDRLEGSAQLVNNSTVADNASVAGSGGGTSDGGVGSWTKAGGATGGAVQSQSDALIGGTSGVVEASVDLAWGLGSSMGVSSGSGSEAGTIRADDNEGAGVFRGTYLPLSFFKIPTLGDSLGL